MSVKTTRHSSVVDHVRVEHGELTEFQDLAGQRRRRFGTTVIRTTAVLQNSLQTVFRSCAFIRSTPDTSGIGLGTDRPLGNG